MRVSTDTTDVWIYYDKVSLAIEYIRMQDRVAREKWTSLFKDKEGNSCIFTIYICNLSSLNTENEVPVGVIWDVTVKEGVTFEILDFEWDVNHSS